MPKKVARHRTPRGMTEQHIGRQQKARRDARIRKLRADYAGRQEEADRLRATPQWRKLSRRKRNINPLCEVCDALGKTTPAADVHHITPISLDTMKLLKLDNLISVCKKHHAKLEGWTWQGYDVGAIIEDLRKSGEVREKREMDAIEAMADLEARIDRIKELKRSKAFQSAIVSPSVIGGGSWIINIKANVKGKDTEYWYTNASGQWDEITRSKAQAMMG